MQLEGGLAVGGFDFTLRGRLTHTQDAVQVLALRTLQLHLGLEKKKPWSENSGKMRILK